MLTRLTVRRPNFRSLYIISKLYFHQHHAERLKSEDDIFNQKLEKLLKSDEGESSSILEEINKENSFSLKNYLPEDIQTSKEESKNVNLDSKHVQDIFQEVLGKNFTFDDPDQTMLSPSGITSNRSYEKNFSQAVRADRLLMNGILKDLNEQKLLDIPNKRYRDTLGFAPAKSQDTEGWKKAEQIGLQRISEALQPTLDHIENNINTDHDFVQFIHNNIIDLFAISAHSATVGAPSIFDTLSGSENIDFPHSKQVSEIREQSKKYPDRPLVNEHTFAVLLCHCFKTYYNNFDKPSAYDDISTAFETIRNSDHPERVVYGCNTDMYHFMIEITWEQTRDLFRVQRLLFEAKVGGTELNTETIRIIDDVFKKARALYFVDYTGFSKSSQKLTEQFDVVTDVDDWNKGSKFWNQEDINRLKKLREQLYKLVDEKT